MRYLFVVRPRFESRRPTELIGPSGPGDELLYFHLLVAHHVFCSAASSNTRKKKSNGNSDRSRIGIPFHPHNLAGFRATITGLFLILQNQAQQQAWLLILAVSPSWIFVSSLPIPSDTMWPFPFVFRTTRQCCPLPPYDLPSLQIIILC